MLNQDRSCLVKGLWTYVVNKRVIQEKETELRLVQNQSDAVWNDGKFLFLYIGIERFGTIGNWTRFQYGQRCRGLFNNWFFFLSWVTNMQIQMNKAHPKLYCSHASQVFLRGLIYYRALWARLGDFDLLKCVIYILSGRFSFVSLYLSF